MSNLDELYQSVILEHDRNPRNFRVLEGPHQEAEGYNPLCGDRVRVMVTVADGRIADLAFQGSGCAISKASASLMTEALKGRTVEEAANLFEAFRDRLMGGGAEKRSGGELPTRLRALEGVRSFPMRIKCATLAWHALNEALEKAED